MRKETVIRQNRCDQEMRFLLFGCFFLFMAMELLGGEQSTVWADRISRAACMTAASGFFFLLGYRFRLGLRTGTEEETRQRTLHLAVGCALIFLILALGQAVVVDRMPVKRSIADIVTLVTIPSVSMFFFALFLLLFFVWIFFGTVEKITSNKKISLIMGAAVLLCAFLRTGEESYTITAVLFGQNTKISIPIIPYFAYFLAGAWIEKEKPAFQWKLAGMAAAVSAAAAVLYGTPLQSLALVLLPVFPVYLIYAAAEGLVELTLRFRPVRKCCEWVLPVFWIYTLAPLVLGRKEVLAGRSAWMILASAVILVIGTYVGIACWNGFVRGYAACSEYFVYRIKHKTAAYFLIYTLVFSVFLFLTFFEFFRTGTTFIIKGDGVAQYFPRIIYFSRYIRELVSNLLQGNFTLPMYDFTIGLGTEITYSLEPLYFLYALFPEEHLEFAYNLVTLLRFYFAGISMSVLCLYFKKDYFPTFLAAVVYTICGFSLYGGSMHTMFMIPMIMLPLLIIAIEEILRGRRWQLCTVFVAVSLFSNYYYLYMNTIAMGIYFLVRFFSRKEKEERTFRKFMGRALVICGSYLLGATMSCIVLVTTFGMYLGSGRGGSALIKTPSLFYYGAEWLVSCFMTFLTTANSPGEWLKLGYLPIAMFAVVFLFLRKGRRELKIFSVLALLFMAFPIAGFVFSGFSAVINRWCYMVSLLAAYLVAECWQDMRDMTIRDRKVCAALTVIYGMLAFYGTYKSTRFTKYAFVLLAVTLVVLILCRTDFKRISEAAKKSMMILLTAALVFYQGYSLFHMDGRVDGYAKTGEALADVENTPLQALEELEDDSFYRAAAVRPRYNTYNTSFLLGYNSNTLLCSTFNGAIMQFLENMGCTSYTSIKLTGMNNRTMLDTLSSVKYYGAYAEQKGRLAYGTEEVLRTKIDGKETILYENVNALPLGYTYEDVITEEELEQYPVTQRQEVLLQKVLLHSAEESVGEAPEITGEQLAYTVKESRGLNIGTGELTAAAEKEEADAGAEEQKVYSMTLEFESLPNSELYLVLKDAYLEGNMTEASITITARTQTQSASYEFRPDDYRYHSGQEDYVINLGYAEEPVTALEISFDREGTICLESLELHCQPMDNLSKYTDARKEEILENIEIGTNRVSGTVDLEEDRILAVTIPWQKGWTAYVDGVKTEIQRANYTYMAIPMTAGEHTVEFVFEIPGVTYALMIMAGSAGLFVVLCIGTAVRKRIGKNEKKI